MNLNITIVGNGVDLFVSAITSGGSKAVMFKVNTIGEERFLDCVRQIVESDKRKRQEFGK